MITIEIKPNQFSSRRTCNRIREHGPEFDWPENVSGASGKGFEWLLRCAFDGEFCPNCADACQQWSGWLPRKEFDIVGVKVAMRGKESGHDTTGVLRLV